MLANFYLKNSFWLRDSAGQSHGVGVKEKQQFSKILEKYFSSSISRKFFFGLKPSETCFSLDFSLYGLILACFKPIKWSEIGFLRLDFSEKRARKVNVFFKASVLTDL